RAPDGGSLALIALLEEHDDPVLLGVRRGRADLLEDGPRAVGRPVVHDDDLLPDRDREHALEERAHRPDLVVDGHQDRHPERRLHRALIVASRRRGLKRRSLPARGGKWYAGAVSPAVAARLAWPSFRRSPAGPRGSRSGSSRPSSCTSPGASSR